MVQAVHILKEYCTCITMEYLIAVLKNKWIKKERTFTFKKWLSMTYSLLCIVNNQYQIDKKSLESLRSFNWTRQWPESEMKYSQPSLLVLTTGNSKRKRLKLKKVPPQKRSIPLLTQLSRVAKWNLMELKRPLCCFALHTWDHGGKLSNGTI